VIDDFVDKMRPVVERKPIFRVRPAQVGVLWLPTYGFGSPTSRRLFLPIEQERQLLDIGAKWHWMHGCEKIAVPPSLGDPHPAVPWPKFLYLWVGPDGHPIRKNKEALLIRFKKDLHQRQTQSKTSLRTQEIGVLRLDKESYGVVDPDPSFLEEGM
jgi:hypothetical protein